MRAGHCCGSRPERARKLRTDERVYRFLLRWYPASFRREYEEPMLQLFRDQSRNAQKAARSWTHWRNTFFDTARSSVSLHIENMMRGKMGLNLLSALLFGIAAMIFLGRFELRSDDAGVAVFLILLFTFILGCWLPRYAWMISLLGLSVPFAELVWGRPQPHLNHTTDLALLAGFVLLVGAVGAASGAWVRRMAS